MSSTVFEMTDYHFFNLMELSDSVDRPVEAYFPVDRSAKAGDFWSPATGNETGSAADGPLPGSGIVDGYDKAGYVLSYDI